MSAEIVESAPAAEVAPKKVNAKKGAAPAKPKKVKQPAVHPTYGDMIKAALLALKEKKGSSRAAILKYILQNYTVGENLAAVNAHLRQALKRGVLTNSLKQMKGTGASGSFRLAEPKAAEGKVKKAKKPTAKKTAPAEKKPAAKKASKPKSPKKALILPMDKKYFPPILLYEFKIGSNASEAARNVNDAFGAGSVSERQIRKWFQRFRSGDETLEDKEGRSRHTGHDDNRLRSLVEEDPRKTVLELAEELEPSEKKVAKPAAPKVAKSPSKKPKSPTKAKKPAKVKATKKTAVKVKTPKKAAAAKSKKA